MKLSIVIPYYNRKEMLLKVLRSINSGYPLETIIVDDGSNLENQIYDIDFPKLNIRMVRLDRSEQWRGATIAYNTGFRAVSGDVILINSSECVHIGDVVGYVFENFKPDSYMAFSTLMGVKNLPDYSGNIKDYWWGVHSTIGNSIPYCAAISKENMDILGGYDERFVEGIGYDDYDFTHRVKNLGLEVQIIDSPFVFHQWHKPTDYPNTKNLDLLKKLNSTDPKRIRANVAS